MGCAASPGYAPDGGRPLRANMLPFCNIPRLLNGNLPADILPVNIMLCVDHGQASESISLAENSFLYNRAFAALPPT